MEQTSLAFDAARLRPDSLPVAAYLLATDFGGRLWTGGIVPGELQNKAPLLFDGDAYFDGSLYFDATPALLEVLPRVESFTAVSQQSMPLGTALLVAMGQNERASFAVTLSNGDGLLSQLLGTELLLGRRGTLLFGYSGLAITDYIEKYTGIVTRWTLDGHSLTLEHLEA